jgi:Asp-tRNA(Asn)/Glu-tRNA(Gln) amidotransferase A subunit family amidase
MGGDIGGSVRSPAANCGIYGIKPTPGRLSRAGASAYVKGQDGYKRNLLLAHISHTDMN